jgi:cell division septum initiation protein DivIVA
MDANFCRRSRIVAAEQRANDARERAEQLIQSTKAEAQKSIGESEELARKLVEDAELCSDTWRAQVERLVRLNQANSFMNVQLAAAKARTISFYTSFLPVSEWLKL